MIRFRGARAWVSKKFKDWSKDQMITEIFWDHRWAKERSDDQFSQPTFPSSDVSGKDKILILKFSTSPWPNLKEFIIESQKMWKMNTSCLFRLRLSKKKKKVQRLIKIWKSDRIDLLELRYQKVDWKIFKLRLDWLSRKSVTVRVGLKNWSNDWK